MKSKRSSGDEFSTDASSSASPVTHETYTHGHARATLRQHGKRTADEAAAFLLPELKPGFIHVAALARKAG